jgi:hypothetical protein
MVFTALVSAFWRMMAVSPFALDQRKGNRLRTDAGRVGGRVDGAPASPTESSFEETLRNLVVQRPLVLAAYTQ